AGHGDHPPARSTPKAKSKTLGKKQAPAGHKKHGGHTPAPKPGSSGAGHTGHGVPAHPADHHPAEHAMKGMLGRYDMSREGSGTSWLPDTTPHEGIHGRIGEWTTTCHALTNGVYDNQGGPH